MVRVSILQLVDLDSIFLLSVTNGIKIAITASIRYTHIKTN